MSFLWDFSKSDIPKKIEIWNLELFFRKTEIILASSSYDVSMQLRVFVLVPAPQVALHLLHFVHCPNSYSRKIIELIEMKQYDNTQMGTK